MAKKKIEIKEKQKSRWDYFLEDLVNEGCEFYLTDSGNTISLYISPNWSVTLHRNGKYAIE